MLEELPSHGLVEAGGATRVNPWHAVCNSNTAAVISDDAGEFGKAVEGSQLARGRILDWFHIAMKFKAAVNSVFGSAAIEPRS
jgi:hypothetical protein